MTILHPTEAIARRWNGALSARLQRAPLEEFLRARSLKVAGVGPGQDCDNLSRAAIFIVEGGLRLYFLEREEALVETQHAVVGQAACEVTHALAALISNPAGWRTAALVGTARLLSPWIGLNSAAYASASATHQFASSLTSSSQMITMTLGEWALIAVNQNDQTALDEAALMICAALAQAEQQRELLLVFEPLSKNRAS